MPRFFHSRLLLLLLFLQLLESHPDLIPFHPLPRASFPLSLSLLSQMGIPKFPQNMFDNQLRGTEKGIFLPCKNLQVKSRRNFIIIKIIIEICDLTRMIIFNFIKKKNFFFCWNLTKKKKKKKKKMNIFLSPTLTSSPPVLQSLHFLY